MAATRLELRLGKIERIHRLSKVSAMFEALSGKADADSRLYDFDPNWMPGAALLRIDDGSGNTGRIFVSEGFAFARGFEHESAMSPWRDDADACVRSAVWPGVLDGLPDELQAFDGASDLRWAETTFCYWTHDVDEVWRSGEITLPGDNCGDGSRFVLEDFLCSDTGYLTSIRNYYGFTVSDDTFGTKNP